VQVSLVDSLIRDTPFGRAYGNAIRVLYRGADAVVGVSDGIAHQLTQRYSVPRSKVHVIHNLFDVDDIRRRATDPLPASAAALFRNPVIINVGSLTHQKWQACLIRGFALARRRAPRLQLAILGEGELRRDLEDLCTRLGVADAVHFLGFQANPYQYMARSAAFALTSRYEGLPSVLVEAMACGVPILSTDCRYGAAEILGNSEHGLLLPDLCDAPAEVAEQTLAAGLVRLLQPEFNRHYREKGLARSLDFHKDQVIGQWLKVL
jgi:glycosyltransferase involved in cell wall biosynthesis